MDGLRFFRGEARFSLFVVFADVVVSKLDPLRISKIATV